MPIFDIYNLHRVLHVKDDYKTWEDEYLVSLTEKQRISHGQATLFHSEDAYDTSLFGLSFGKVERVIGDDIYDIKKIVSDFFDLSLYDYCLFRVDQSSISWIQQFERHGALLLDTTVDLVCDLSVIKNFMYKKSKYVVDNLEYKTSLEVLDISKSFHFGRFFTDPDLNKGTQMYRKWIENSVSGKAADKMYVYVKDKHIHGLITIKECVYGSLKGIRIPLVGKHPVSKLHHVAQTMLNHVIADAVEKENKFLLISTQATNIPALISYLGVGCIPYSAEATLGWYKHRSL